MLYGEIELRDIPLNIPKYYQQVETFLKPFGLTVDRLLERYLGAYYNDELVGGAGYGGDVIKCVAIDPRMRGEGIVNTLISRLLSELIAKGLANIFLFTKPANRVMFEDLAFHTIICTDDVLLMETDAKSYPRYLDSLSALRTDGGSCGAIVMNANPFTLGHRYLIEQASDACDRLFVLVVEEDRSLFPAAIRKKLIQAGTADLKNVSLIDGGSYVISGATFPTYFLKTAHVATRAHARLDAMLFCTGIAPALGVTDRFVGEEPLDVTTATYNSVMAETLPAYNIQFHCINRLEKQGAPVSASRVRALIKQDKLVDTAALLPPTTYQFLCSDEAKPIIAKIKNSDSRH
ncbi:MAG: [citrate (pro-3S)-lyase] ligase [Oscillospiraceae bacterium]|nr:[citrate (pro-3S)-lyase] ligase [Oscillospiraceae bacterium]